MILRNTLLILACIVSASVQGQVREIKEASKGSSDGKSVESSSGSNSSSSFGSAFAAEIVFHSFEIIGYWQQETLKKRVENENIVSLDLYLQTGIQPSSYYIIHPRLRANWGLFSSDFRFNYLVEEGIDGVEYLRSDDWQIVQLNILTFNNTTFRVGGGILHEDFSAEKRFQNGPWDYSCRAIIEESAALWSIAWQNHARSFLHTFSSDFGELNTFTSTEQPV